MVVYSFHIFDRHTECVYSKSWLPSSAGSETAAPTTSSDDAKLLFGTVFSLRNMVRKLGGDDDAFISYRTAQYKLHFYETPANLRFVILTDTATLSMRNVLHQIYINLWVEYVVKNPLAPVEHKKGEGVKNELFELGLDQFIRGLIANNQVVREKPPASCGYCGLKNAYACPRPLLSNAISQDRRRVESRDDMTMFPGVKQGFGLHSIVGSHHNEQPRLMASAE